MSFSGSGPEEYDFGVALNSTTDKILLRRRLSSNSDIGNVVATGIIDISESNVVSIYGKSDGTGKSISPLYSNLSLIKISSSDNPTEYAHMQIVNNADITYLSDGWNKEIHFSETSDLKSSNWTFDETNDWLLAGADAPGTYLVNYHLGMNLSISDITVEPEFAIFINEVEQLKLINKRALTKKDNDDVGSVSGTGIITVLNSNDKITLRMRDPLWTDTSPDFIIKYSNVNLCRVKEIPPVPVELISFSATAIAKGVMLSWSTSTEVNNYGFEVQKSEVRNQKSEFETIGFVEGHGNSNSPKDYSFYDKSPLMGKRLYRLKQIDTDGAFEYSDEVEISFLQSDKIELFQNHPNPFNPSTVISFNLPELSHVSITVYNAIGQKVAELMNKEMDAGYHNINFNASNLSTGFYFYRLETKNYSKTMKMILLR